MAGPNAGMGSARSRARSWALALLYAWEISDTDLLPSEHARRTLETRRMSPRYREYSERLVSTVEAHLPEIDATIADVAANWRLDRIGTVDRNVLRIGIAELLWCDDVPSKVAIHEAVRLANRYGGAESARFVNGVLDAVYRREAAST